MGARSAVVLTAVAVSLFLAPAVADDWLVDAPDEQARAERLSSYLGGFSAAMWETGERYERMIQAVRDGNHELARYHWDKIGDAIRGGYLKRPARRANADALFMETIWPKYLETLDSGDLDRIREGFAEARSACMSCHEAEGVGFMNDQPLFTVLGVDDSTPGPYSGARVYERVIEKKIEKTGREAEQSGGAASGVRIRICPDPDEPCWGED